MVCLSGGNTELRSAINHFVVHGSISGMVSGVSDSELESSSLSGGWQQWGGIFLNWALLSGILFSYRKQVSMFDCCHVAALSLHAHLHVFHTSHQYQLTNNTAIN